MDKEKFLSSGLLDQFVLGLASEEDVETVLEYAEAFPDIKEMIESLQHSLEQYAISNSVEPPPDLRERTFQQLNEEIAQASGKMEKKQIPNKGSFSKTGLWIAGITILGLIYCISHFNGKYQESQSMLTQKELQLLDCQEEIQVLEADSRIIALQNSFLRDENTMHIHLRGTALAPEALAVVFWNEETQKSYLKIVNLPAPAPDKQYQLWADVEGEMINMGVFDMKKEQLIEMPYIAHAESLNVTLEKLGGAETPNVSQLVMNGKV